MAKPESEVGATDPGAVFRAALCWLVAWKWGWMHFRMVFRSLPPGIGTGWTAFHKTPEEEPTAEERTEFTRSRVTLGLGVKFQRNLAAPHLTFTVSLSLSGRWMGGRAGRDGHLRTEPHRLVCLICGRRGD